MKSNSCKTTLILAVLIIFGISMSNHVYAAPGDLDPTFGNHGRVQTTIPGSGTEVSIQSDGKIIVHSNSSIYRLNPDGTPDPTFGTNGQLELSPGGDFAILPDGRILGTTSLFSAVYQQTYGVVYWFDADGHPPLVGIEMMTFDLCYCDTRGYKIAIGQNGQIFVAAVISTTPETTRIGGFSAHGTQNFGVNLGTETVYKMKVQTDGKLVVLTAHGIIRRYNANGTPDHNFGTGGSIVLGDVYVGDLVLQADGKILVSYEEEYYSNPNAFIGVRRFNSDGTPDTTFGGATTYYQAFAIQSDGKILVGGTWSGNHPWRFGVNRLLTNGALDYSFGQYGEVITAFAGFSSGVRALATQPDGKIIAAGEGSGAGGSGILLARYENEVPETTPFDYDGDGRADISVWRPSNGIWHLSRSQAGYTAMTWGEPTDKLAPADFDGDGITDMAVWRPSTGAWYVVNSGTGTFTVRFWGQSGDVPVPADYDGDGNADLAVFRPSSGTWYRINSSNGHWVVVPYAQEGDIPVVGDYDADGRADLAVYRPSNGNWYVQRTSAGYVVIPFGAGSGPIVPADYTGDGRTDIAVISPQSGNWIYYNWDTGLPTIVIDGYYQPGDIPVPADYDGDGRANFAIFRPSTGMWRIPGPGGLIETQFGEQGDIPTAAAFN